MPVRTRYRFNPDCICDICRNGGVPPAGHPESGHSFCYGEPHFESGEASVNVIGLLSFYDEDPGWLTDAILSLGRVGVSHLIALDGAYALYPDGTASSAPEQHQAIREACNRTGIHLTLETPDMVWAGNEVEKRNHLFALAEQHATPGDWYMIVDADETIVQTPNDVAARLAASPFDVAAVTLREPGHPQGTIVFPTHPKFFRAIPGLRAVKDHFTYTTPDGRKLWGDAKRDRLEPRQDLTSVVVENRSQLRHPDRRQAAKTYFDRRDSLHIEDIPTSRSLLKDAA